MVTIVVAMAKRRLVVVGNGLEEVLEGLRLAREGESSGVAEAELLLRLLQQDGEDRMSQVACGDHEPPELHSDVDGEVPLGDVRRRVGALAALLVGLADDVRVHQPPANRRRQPWRRRRHSLILGAGDGH